MFFFSFYARDIFNSQINEIVPCKNILHLKNVNMGIRVKEIKGKRMILNTKKTLRKTIQLFTT